MFIIKASGRQEFLDQRLSRLVKSIFRQDSCVEKTTPERMLVKQGPVNFCFRHFMLCMQSEANGICKFTPYMPSLMLN